MKLTKSIFFLCVFLLFSSKDYAIVDLPQRHPPQEKLLLITGCGRSGTAFMSAFLQASGVQVDHEAEGIDGIVSWPMAVNWYSPWIKMRPKKLVFTHVFHQVRDPLAVISSWFVNLQNLNRDEWKFVRNYVPEIIKTDSLIVHCAKYYYFWNLKVEAMAEWRFRIEDIDNLLPELERRLGIPFSHEILNTIPRNLNTWTSIPKKITWSQLKEGLPRDLFQKLQGMAIRYGYAVD